LNRELEVTSKRFEQFAIDSGLFEAPEPERWYPHPFDWEVCCMPGMSCYTGDFANAAGRAQIVRELEQYRIEREEKKAYFDELDADNQRELAEERKILLASSRTAALKLNNQIGDQVKLEADLVAAIPDLVEPELAAAQTALAEIRAGLTTMRNTKTENDQSFAEME
jgi:hypothetical protein